MTPPSPTLAPSAPHPAPAAERRLVLPFDPAHDGFSFGNAFEWAEEDLTYLAARTRPFAVLAGAALAGGTAAATTKARTPALAAAAAGAGLSALALGEGAVRGVARRWPHFGLCGGMALAAAERWAPAGASRPPGRTVTGALGMSHVRALLRRRQEATIRASLARFVAYWALARFVPGFAEYPPLERPLARELARVERGLEKGRPVLLGLAGDAPDPFALHQVLAFGIERTNGALGATLHVYDPNAPGKTRFIHTGPAPGRPGCVSIRTDIPTGRTPGGSAHIATRAGQLTMLFVIEA